MTLRVPRFARNDAAAGDNYMALRTEGALRPTKKQRVGVIPRHVVPRKLMREDYIPRHVVPRKLMLMTACPFLTVTVQEVLVVLSLQHSS
jgi:hypothetical protein